MFGQKKEHFIAMFKKFHDYDFIWKWTEDLPGLPRNVLASEWLPQQDILAHKNVKLFITHVGFGSLQETICYQKPIIAIPVFGDQFSNALEAKRLGLGEYILFNKLEYACYVLQKCQL